jgi:hypothetical protein
MIRGVVFNRVILKLVWDPVFAWAERSSRLAGVTRPALYRGGLASYFFKGRCDGNRQFGVPQPERVSATQLGEEASPDGEASKGSSTIARLLRQEAIE